MADHAQALNLALLTTELPSPQIAAALLARTQLHEPLRMPTPPDPMKVRPMCRGPWMKAATIARSTDDPALLDHLAGHSSVNVRADVLANRATSNATRRRLEDRLRPEHHTHAELLVEGASTDYLRELLAEPARIERLDTASTIARRIVADDHCQELLLAALALGSRPLRQHLVSCVASRGIRGLDLAQLDAVDPLSAVADQSGSQAQSAAFSRLVTSRMRTVGTTALAWMQSQAIPYEQVFTTYPDHSRFTRRAGQLLLETLDAAQAALVLERTPGTERFDVYLARFGLEALCATGTWRHPDTDAIKWITDLLAAGTPLPPDAALNVSPAVLKELHAAPRAVHQLVRAGNASALHQWFSGSLETLPDPTLAAELARRHPSTILRQIQGSRALRGTAHGRAALRALLEDDTDEIVFGALGELVPDAPTEEIVGYLQALHDRHGRWTVLALSTSDAARRLAASQLDPGITATWLRLAGDANLTARYLCGRFETAPCSEVLDALLADPGSAFTTRPSNRHLPGSEQLLTQKILELLDADSAAQITDHAARILSRNIGHALSLAQSGRSRDMLAAMIAQRFATVSNGSDSVYMTAIEMLTRSELPLDRVLSSVSRLTSQD